MGQDPEHMGHPMTTMVAAEAFLGGVVPTPRGEWGVLVGIRAAPQSAGERIERQA